MANQDIVYNWGVVNRGLPGTQGDNATGPMRVGRRGEIYAQPFATARTAISDEGTYFIAHNAIVDVATTLAGHAAPVLVDIDITLTKAFLHFIFPVASTSLLRAYMDFIEIDVITPGANGTSDMWTMQLDTGATRVSSAGTALTTVNPNMQSSAVPALVPTGGVITVGAETSACRVIGHGVFRPSIAIAGDRYRFNFADNRSTGGSVVSTSTAHHVQDIGPVVLGPTDQLILGLGAPSQSAAAVYKVRAGWWER